MYDVFGSFPSPYPLFQFLSYLSYHFHIFNIGFQQEDAGDRCLERKQDTHETTNLSFSEKNHIFFSLQYPCIWFDWAFFFLYPRRIAKEPKWDHRVILDYTRKNHNW